MFLQHHPSLEDVLIVQENEYCQSKSITIFIGIIYAYKGVLLVSSLVTSLTLIFKNFLS